MPWRNGWEPGAGVVARRGVDRLVFVDCLAALGLQERLGQGGRSRLGLGEGQHPTDLSERPRGGERHGDVLCRHRRPRRCGPVLRDDLTGAVDQVRRRQHRPQGHAIGPAPVPDRSAGAAEESPSVMNSCAEP